MLYIQLIEFVDTMEKKCSISKADEGLNLDGWECRLIYVCHSIDWPLEMFLFCGHHSVDLRDILSRMQETQKFQGLSLSI